MIDNQIEYNRLLKSGMFWEFFPDLTGDWEKDEDEFNKFADSRSKFKFQEFEQKGSNKKLNVLTLTEEYLNDFHKIETLDFSNLEIFKTALRNARKRIK